MQVAVYIYMHANAECSFSKCSTKFGQNQASESMSVSYQISFNEHEALNYSFHPLLPFSLILPHLLWVINFIIPPRLVLLLPKSSLFSLYSITFLRTLKTSIPHRLPLLCFPSSASRLFSRTSLSLTKHPQPYRSGVGRQACGGRGDHLHGVVSLISELGTSDAELGGCDGDSAEEL